MARTKVYVIWSAMKRRCTNPNVVEWKNYGGRGIGLCERWLAFENFFADMGEPPQGKSLDRIDVNGDYSPENCRWATYEQQARNTRSNRIVCIDGVLMPVMAACEVTGIPHTTVYSRIHNKWPESKWFSKSTRKPASY